MNFLKRHASFILAILLVAGVGIGGTIKTWTTSETLTASDLNATFQHIHNTMVGGHGARLVNGDVSATAAIAHSKMATPSLIPKAWAYTTAVCDAAAANGTVCGSTLVVGIDNVTATANAGIYRVNLAYTAANANYVVQVTCQDADGLGQCLCHVPTLTVDDAIVRCRNSAGSDANMKFSVVVWDDN